MENCNAPCPSLDLGQLDIVLAGLGQPADHLGRSQRSELGDGGAEVR
jgi:hypothetical protein